MIVEHASHPQFVSNTYLVADGDGGPAFFIDAGGPVAPLIEAAERLELEPTHLLLTHHHFDHVCEAQALRERWPRAAGADQRARARPAPGERRSGRVGQRRGRRARWRPGPSRRARRCPSASSRCARCTRPGTRPGCCRSWSARRRWRRAAVGPGRGGVHRRHAVQGLGGRRAGARATPATSTCATRSWAR